MMKSIYAVGLTVLFALVATAHASAQAIQVVTVNTSDTAGYLEWVQEAAPVFIGASSGPGAVGACVPVSGAEREGDIYWFAAAANAEALLALDPSTPAIAREVAKASSIRTVRTRDVMTIAKPSARRLETGSRYGQWAVFVETSNPGSYVSGMRAMEAAYHEHGFQDLNIAVYSIRTGEQAGKLMTSVTGATMDRVGAAVDALSESWAVAQLSQIEGSRTIVRAAFSSCQVYASR